MKTSKSPARNSLIFLLIFLGLGAMGGGGVLIISPSGQLIGMPLSMLAKSPFTSFLIPGLLLFFVLGLAPGLLALALLNKPDNKFAEQFNLFKDMHWAWTYSIYIAFALIIWIQLQMMFLEAVHWLHTFYMFYAIALITAALLRPVRNHYRK